MRKKIRFINFETPYYSTSKYDASKPYTPPKTPKTKKTKLGKIGKKAVKFISKNKIGLGLGAGVLATGLIANQIRKSKTKKQNPLNRFIK